MNFWHAALYFCVGWVANWYIGGRLVRLILRRSKGDVVSSACDKMPHDILMLWHGCIEAEIAKRRGT